MKKAYFDKSFLKDREVQEGKKTFLQKSFSSPPAKPITYRKDFL
jgi:hypothetical protein